PTYPLPLPSILTLSLHDALPILLMETTTLYTVPVEGAKKSVNTGARGKVCHENTAFLHPGFGFESVRALNGSNTDRYHSGRSPGDRKSTRLNSSHEWISYAVFCL